MEGNLAPRGRHHGLEREQNAAVVQRGNDLVRRAHIFLAQRLKFDVRPVGDEGAAPLGLRGVERFLRMGEDLGDGAGMAWRCQARFGAAWQSGHGLAGSG